MVFCGRYLLFLVTFLLPEGKLLITEIKNSWNNFRLSTHYLNNKKNLSINFNFEDKFNTLFSLSYPYEIKTLLDLGEVLII